MPTQSETVWAGLANLLRSYGLDSLLGWARDQFLEGKTDAEIMLGLEDQPIVKQKFSAVFERRAKGLPPISFQDVIDYQRSARAAEQLWGMPAGFIDVNRLLLEDVSPTEMGKRLALASDYINTRTDVQEQWDTLFANGKGRALAAFVDPNTALPVLEQEKQAAANAAEARRATGMQLTRDEALRLAKEGVTTEQARAGFTQLATDKELLAPLVSEDLLAFTRDEQLALAAGSNTNLLRELDRRRRSRLAVFTEGGSLAATNQGITGAGAATRI